MLRNPYTLGGPHQKTEELLHNWCILGGPQQRGQSHKWRPHPTFSGTQKRADLLRNRCVLRGPQKGAKKCPHRAMGKNPFRGVLNGGPEKKGPKGPPSSQGLQVGLVATEALPFGRVPNASEWGGGG